MTEKQRCGGSSRLEKPRLVSRETSYACPGCDDCTPGSVGYKGRPEDRGKVPPATPTKFSPGAKQDSIGEALEGLRGLLKNEEEESRRCGDIEKAETYELGRRRLSTVREWVGRMETRFNRLSSALDKFDPPPAVAELESFIEKQSDLLEDKDAEIGRLREEVEETQKRFDQLNAYAKVLIRQKDDKINTYRGALEEARKVLVLLGKDLSAFHSFDSELVFYTVETIDDALSPEKKPKGEVPHILVTTQHETREYKKKGGGE